MKTRTNTKQPSSQNDNAISMPAMNHKARRDVRLGRLRITKTPSGAIAFVRDVEHRVAQ